MKRRLLITGATGFVGSNLIKKISLHDNQVAAVVRNKTQAENILGNRIQLIEFNENDGRYLSEIRDFDPYAVVHLASFLTNRSDTATLKKLLDSNIRFGSLLLDALVGTGVKYFINTGSFSEYLSEPQSLDPAYLYSATKTAFRSLLDFYRKTSGFQAVQVVPYTIYGPDDTGKKALDYIIQALDSDEPVEMTEGRQVLDMIYIDDVVDFYLKLLSNISETKTDFSTYHLGSGTGVTLRSLAAVVEELSGKKANIIWGALPYRDRDIMCAIAPTEAACKDFDWRPKVGLQEGVLKTLRYSMETTDE